VQQYVYDEVSRGRGGNRQRGSAQAVHCDTLVPCAIGRQDTGQLCRVGQGGDTTRLGRHYLEDAHTGAFYPLAAAGGSGCWQWLRCAAHMRLLIEGWLRPWTDSLALTSCTCLPAC
jgi:hypothetical protein